MKNIITLEEKFLINEYEVLLEQLDESDLRQIANAFARIDAIMQNINVPAIDEPVDEARQKLTQLISGKGGLLQKMMKNFSQKKTLVDILTIQVQLVSLFRSLPQILTLAGKDLKNIINARGSGILKDSGIATLLEDQPQKLDRIRSLIEKSLKPSMLQSVKIDPSACADQLLNLPLTDFNTLIKRAAGAKITVPVEQEDVEQLTDKEAVKDDNSVNSILNKLARDPQQAKNWDIFLTTLKDDLGLRMPDNLVNGVKSILKKRQPKMTTP